MVDPGIFLRFEDFSSILSVDFLPSEYVNVIFISGIYTYAISISLYSGIFCFHSFPTPVMQQSQANSEYSVSRLASPSIPCNAF